MIRALRSFAGILAAVAAGVALSAQAPPPSAPAAANAASAPRTRATGDQHRQYVFTPTGQQLPYRVFVPPSWDGKASLPIILMLHGAGSDENSYINMNDGLLPKLAAQHG